MADEFPFDECDATYLFDEVTKRLESRAARTLWTRIRAEINRKGVGGAITYLESEFTRLREDCQREIDRVNPEEAL